MFKKLIEKRAALQAEMEVMLNLAETEERALTEEEQTKFEAMENEIRAIDKTLEKANASRNLQPVVEEQEERAQESVEEQETRAFDTFIRGYVNGNVETRANLSDGSSGKILPATISDKVVARVRVISPLLERCDLYNVAGTVSIPVYTEDNSDKINAAYATEFTDLTANAGTLTSVNLSGFVIGALSKVSKSLIRNAAFDVVSFVIDEMAKALAAFIEKELIVGTNNKIAGLSGATNTTTAASTTAITADELITIQDSIPDAYQADAIWIVNPATRTAIRKLKNSQGDYILNKDATMPWGYELFGKPVYVSENVPTMAASARAIFYGDMTGLAVQLADGIEIEVLNELYAAAHAVGVVGFAQVDAKVQNQQKIAVGVMHA